MLTGQKRKPQTDTAHFVSHAEREHIFRDIPRL